MLDRATIHPVTYIVANHYQDAIDYVHRMDLNAAEVRFVSCPQVLAGATKPKVIVLGAADQVPDSIIEVLARREADVTYETIQ